MVKCVDAAFLTRNGILFTAVPLDLLKEAQDLRDRMVGQGATSIKFAVTIDLEDEGRSFSFEAMDIWIRTGTVHA